MPRYYLISPLERDSSQFYRLVSDLFEDNFETSTMIETVPFQVDGFWDADYTTSANGTIGGVAVTVSESLAIDAGFVMEGFAFNDFWNSSLMENIRTQPSHLIHWMHPSTFKWIAAPVAITGYYIYNMGSVPRIPL